MSRPLYDIFDPNCYNNVFVFTYSNEPIVVAGCYVPTSPEKRSFKMKSFYNWLSYIISVYTDGNWALHSCDIKPGSAPFSVDINSAFRGPIDRESEDHLAPGAYLILSNGTNFSPEVSMRAVTSRQYILFPRELESNTPPLSIPPSSICNITGTPLDDGDRNLVQIIRNRDIETRPGILLRPFGELPSDLDTARNYLTMTSSVQSQFDKFAFGIDVDDNYRIVQFVKPSLEFDISQVGILKIPEGQPKPYDECLRLHFHYCLRMYVSCPPPGVQTYSMAEIEDLQDAVGMFERDEDPPPRDDPIWDSDLGREVLRSVMAYGLLH